MAFFVVFLLFLFVLLGWRFRFNLTASRI